MSELEVFLRLAFLGLAFLMFTLSLMSLAKTREIKIVLATIGFGIFVIEGAVLAGGIFYSGLEDLVSTSLLVGVNLVALIFLYLSIIKR